MCGLCGLIAEQRDWSDGISLHIPRRQERYRKITIINKILKYYGTTVSDFQGVNYLLQNQTGKTEIVNGLAILWDEVHKMTHKKVDVLDEKFLNYIVEKTNR